MNLVIVVSPWGRVGFKLAGSGTTMNVVSAGKVCFFVSAEICLFMIGSQQDEIVPRFISGFNGFSLRLAKGIYGNHRGVDKGYGFYDYRAFFPPGELLGSEPSESTTICVFRPEYSVFSQSVSYSGIVGPGFLSNRTVSAITVAFPSTPTTSGPVGSSTNTKVPLFYTGTTGTFTSSSGDGSPVRFRPRSNIRRTSTRRRLL